MTTAVPTPAGTAGGAKAARRHALAALQGLAVGDALGMPTQLLPREEIAAQFGTLTGFQAGRPGHPIAAGMPAGSVTDDTEQAMLLARRLIADRGRVDPQRWAADLTAWEEDMRARGSLDLLGPSTKAALAALAAGSPPEEAGRHGTTNGAAMRVTPVGIAFRPGDLERLADRVAESAAVTHNTGVALSAACAVAAAVSTGISCAGEVAPASGAAGESAGRGGTAGPFEACVRRAVAAARIGARRGHWVAGADVGRRIEWAVEQADPADVAGSLARILELVGTSLASQESVPAAFGLLALFPGDPWRACLAAAGLGGDTDTIAAISGAIGGAVFGPVFPAEAVRTVVRVNRLDLPAVTDGLLRLRWGPGGPDSDLAVPTPPTPGRPASTA